MRLLTLVPMLIALFIPPAVADAQPYDFAAAEELLTSELPKLKGHVAVIVRQGGTELHRYQAGDIGFDTRTRLAGSVSTRIYGSSAPIRDVFDLRGAELLAQVSESVRPSRRCSITP